MPRGLAAVAALALLPGCVSPLVSGGAIREAPYRDLWSRTAAARGAEAFEPVPARLIAPVEIPALVRELVTEDWRTQDLVDYQEALVAVGVWPPDRDLIDEYAAVSATEFSGFYAPTRHSLYVVNDLEPSLWLRVLSSFARRDREREREVTLAHEIVHALQHASHPSLVEDDANWKTQDDAALAVQAALEGDAMLYGILALAPGLAPPDPDAMREDMNRALGAGGRLSRAPVLMQLSLLFPYAEGYPLSLAERGALLDQPPASTEQVLHPERRRADFLAIDLAGLGATLPRGCRALFENTLGEFGISVLLRDLGESADAGPWEGWDGDRYLAARCGERRELFWITAWDAEGDAREFAEAYARVAPAAAERAGFSAPLRAVLRGREVWLASEGLASWLGADPPPVRRARVATLAALRSHFAGPESELE